MSENEQSKRKWTWPWQIGKSTEEARITNEVEIIADASNAIHRQEEVSEALEHELETLKDNRVQNHFAAAVISAWQPNAQAAARRAAT